MITLLVITWVLIAALLAVVAAVRPKRTMHSRFELERRGDSAVLRRERLIGHVLTLRGFIASLLALILGVVGFTAWQLAGVLASVGMLVLVIPLARLNFIHHFAMRLYERREESLLRFFERSAFARRLLPVDASAPGDQKLESTEQLTHLVKSAGHILTREQQSLINHGLKWHGLKLSDVMTPAKEIVTIKRTELLGPLVLDDLHKSGHHRFVVIDKNIDHVIGQINIAEMLEIDATKKSQSAADVMSPIDIRLPADTLLPKALDQLLEHPGQLGLVVNGEKTVGLVTIRDLLKVLLG